MKVALFIVAALMALFNADAFVVTPQQPLTDRVAPLSMTKLTYNGKSKEFRAGSNLGAAARSLGMKITYSCKKGDCATCEISVAGRRTKCCVGKVPPAPGLKSLQEKGLQLSN